MKKIFLAVLVSCLAAGVAMAADKKVSDDWAKEVLGGMKSDNVNPESILNPAAAGSSFVLGSDGDNITLIFKNPTIVPKGKDETGKTFMRAESVKFTVDNKNYLCRVTAQDNGGEVVTSPCVFPNPAKKSGIPEVIYLHGIGTDKSDKPGFTLLNPNDPAVVYSTKNGDWPTEAGDKANLGTLSIGIYVHPSKPPAFSKPLFGGKDKMSPGQHPELANR